MLPKQTKSTFNSCRLMGMKPPPRAVAFQALTAHGWGRSIAAAMGSIKRVPRSLVLIALVATLETVGAGLGLEPELKAAPLGVQLGALVGLQEGGRRTRSSRAC